MPFRPFSSNSALTSLDNGHKPGLRAYLRNPRAHQPTPHDPNFFYSHARFLKSADSSDYWREIPPERVYQRPATLRTLRPRLSTSSDLFSVSTESVLNRFDNHRDTLSTANACRCQSIPQILAAQFIQHCDHQPRPRRAERMTKGNRPAVHIGFVAFKSQFLFDRQILRQQTPRSLPARSICFKL